MTPLESLNVCCKKCNNPFIDETTRNLIATYKISGNACRTESLKYNKVLFVISGAGVLNLPNSRKIKLHEGSVFLLPMGCDYRIDALSEMFISEFILDEIITCAHLESYIQDNKSRKGKTYPYVMDMNEKLWLYISHTVEFLKDGLSCRCYQKMKIEELFHILKLYYPAESLNRFFMPMCAKNPRFAMLVYDNWDKVETLNELAGITGLSLSGFSKKFRRIFTVSAYQWIMDKKGDKIIEELFNGNKTIKQLTKEYSFYSVQHFGYYCKKRFGYSPGKIRQMAKNKEYKNMG